MLFVWLEGSFNIYGYFFDIVFEMSGIGYYYFFYGINVDDYVIIVNWGMINIGSEYYYFSFEIFFNGYYEFSIVDGISLDDDICMLNWGVFNIEYVGDDGIEMDEDVFFVNCDFVSLYYIGDEGIDMDEDVIVCNSGQIDIFYVNYQGIDQDDSDMEFINFGEFNILFIDDEEGIEFDDGFFKNIEMGVVNIVYVANDLFYICFGVDFENYGVVNFDVVLFNLIMLEIVVFVLEILDIDEDMLDVVFVEEFIYGVILIIGGDFYNYSEINILFFQFFGSLEILEEVFYYFIFVLLLNVGGDFYNEDCVFINIDGFFLIINEVDFYNEGMIDLFFGDIFIFFDFEEGLGLMFGEYINEGYFYNDGDILFDYLFLIGLNLIDELWIKFFIGDEGENDNFLLGCDIIIMIFLCQGYKVIIDNVVFFN